MLSISTFGKLRHLLTLLAVLMMSSAALGQRYVDNYGGNVSYHSSTVAEGAQRGLADVVRSAGEYNLNTAQAASTAQDAISKNLDNHMKATNTYFEMRLANRQYQKQLETPPLSSEQLYRIAAQEAPKPLPANYLDPLTGQISWPVALQGDEYADVRTKLDGLFTLRAKEGSSHYVFQIQDVANEALAQLKANIREYPAPEYLQSKRFLESLAFSARAPNL